MNAGAGEVTLIEASDLADSLSAGATPFLIQVTSAALYAQAHLPDARLVTPEQLVSGIPPATGKLPDRQRLVELFEHLGYTPDSDIIVYDDEGGGWAGRLGWTLDCIGHRHWRYLNGGLHAWAAAGLALQSGAPRVVPSSDNASLAVDTAPVAEIPDVLKAIEQNDCVILDVRSAEEYRGEKRGAARVGHIPGAINYDWLQMKDVDDHQRLARNLKAELAQIGVDGSKPIITHCQTHHRSGLSYLVGRLFGYDIRAYHGSWSEWGNREDTPIEVDDP